MMKLLINVHEDRMMVFVHSRSLKLNNYLRGRTILCKVHVISPF